MTRYEIHYENGIVQTKTLIDKVQFDFLNRIKSNIIILKKQIKELELSKQSEKQSKEIVRISENLVKCYGDVFVVDSPLHEAMTTGLLDCNGSQQKVTFCLLT